MSKSIETIVEDASIGSGASNRNNGFSKDPDADEVGLIIRGDSNTDNIDVVFDGVEHRPSDTPHVDANFSPTFPTTVDATGDNNNNIAVRLSGLRGFGHVFVGFMNNGAGSTTITVDKLQR